MHGNILCPLKSSENKSVCKCWSFMSSGILCCDVGSLFQDYHTLKRNTLISLRSSVFCDVTQHWLVVTDRRFGRACLFRNVGNYQSTLRNIPEERMRSLNRHWSLKSHTVILINIWNHLTKVFEFSVTIQKVIFRIVIYMTIWLCYWVILLSVSKYSGMLWLKCVNVFSK